MLHVDIPTRAEIEALMLNHGARVRLGLPTTPLTQAAQVLRTNRLEILTAAGVEQLARPRQA